MPIPMEIQHATEEFERFLRDAKDNAHLTTRNQTCTMVQGVLVVFRHRLDVIQAVAFANILPPVLRAIFIAGWNPAQPPRPFVGRGDLTREVQDLRRDHNFSPDSCIEDVARALWRHCDTAALEGLLDTLGAEAKAFWHVPALRP